MSVSRFANIHRVLSQYTFEIADGSIVEDLLCRLCKKLMNDACQTSCGCQYCYRCISNYLEQGPAYCPGRNSECEEDHLNLEMDVFRNVRLETRISKIVVKCPNRLCKLAIALTQIDEHLLVCIKEPSQCPYATIGCIDENATKERLLEHLKREVLSHTQLMISFTNNIKNEFDGLKEMMELLKLEIIVIREEMNKNEEHQSSERRNMESYKEHMMAFIGQQVGDLRNEMEDLSSSVIGDGSSDDDAQRERSLKCTVDQMQARIIVNELWKEVERMKLEVERCNTERERQMNNLIRINKLRPIIDVDFMWRIEDYSKKRRTVTDIYSEPFHSNEYKLCLNLYIYGDNIGLWCVLIKGERDERLEWPLRRTVTLSVLDQDTLLAHRSLSFQYDSYSRNKKAFERPSGDRNDYCIGTDSIIQYSLIKESPSVLVNDSVVVSCVIR